MTRLEILTDLLSKKVERQTILKQRSDDLYALDDSLAGARIGRWIGSSYHSIKRIVCLSLGILFVLAFLSLTLYPGLLADDPAIRSIMLKAELQEVTELTGMRVVADEISDHEAFLDKLMDEHITFLRYCLLTVGLFFIYLARMAKKVVARNRKISEAEKVTQEVIDIFQQTIEEEEKELVVLNELVRKNIGLNTQPAHD